MLFWTFKDRIFSVCEADSLQRSCVVCVMKWAATILSMIVDKNKTQWVLVKVFQVILVHGRLNKQWYDQSPFEVCRCNARLRWCLDHDQQSRKQTGNRHRKNQAGIESRAVCLGSIPDIFNFCLGWFQTISGDILYKKNCFCCCFTPNDFHFLKICQISYWKWVLAQPCQIHT